MIVYLAWTAIILSLMVPGTWICDRKGWLDR